jgi:hypothetical protein
VTTTLFYAGIRHRQFRFRPVARLRLVRFRMWMRREDLCREMTGRVSVGGVRAAVRRDQRRGIEGW